MLTVCRRQQYEQERHDVPPFVKLYEVRSITGRIVPLLTLFKAFLQLEHEIEEYLPQFQELLLTLRSVMPFMHANTQLISRKPR